MNMVAEINNRSKYLHIAVVLQSTDMKYQNHIAFNL